MLAVELIEDVRGFMGKLLREDSFNLFETRSLEILARNHITIEGSIETQGAEDSSEKITEFSTWGDLRPLIYEIVKLSPKPTFIKIIFSQKSPGEIHPNAAALFLNLLYENDKVTFTTATSQKEFALNKDVDNVWDDTVRKFFADTGIGVKDRE